MYWKIYLEEFRIFYKSDKSDFNNTTFNFNLKTIYFKF